ncbi:1-phosphofructokinase family hexose kinase [Arthrobacter sp. FB24]|jgi:1-phosphofructokinase|uniref:1-phosphofructokinase family hexose kinase n=1 Tax=Arthrobacter sp. (strain FB24) TaxID=290399 RepID=UPI0000527426|nr:PfkB family carbohydrate kinase [Arthrobacter sp. FB24]
MSLITQKTSRAGEAARHGALSTRRTGKESEQEAVGRRQVVVTLTPSPVVDRVYFFEDLVPGTVNRALTVEQYLGGNGINVARTLRLAGNLTRAVAPVSAKDPSGLELMRREGELIRTVLVSPPTRINTVLVSSDGSTTNANQKPGLLPEAEWRSVCEATLDELRTLDADWLVVAGALPMTTDGNPVDLRWLLAQVQQLGVKVCLDVNGADLGRWATSGLVDLVKPNLPELESVAGRQLSTLGDVVAAARELVDAGVGTVLASMGADGLIGVCPNGVRWARVPTAPVINTTGAGDAALAGFLSEGSTITCGNGGSPWTIAFSAALARSAAWGALAVACSTTLLQSLNGTPDVTVQEPDATFRLNHY